MKSNGLLKWLMIPVVLLVVFVGIKLFSRDHQTDSAPPKAGGELTPEEMKTLGVEGDTPRDTVATLVGQVKQLRNELKTSLSDNQQQKSENERLRQRESDIDQRIQGALSAERDSLRQDREQSVSDTQSLLQDLQRRLDSLSSKPGQPELPVGLGLQEGDESHFANGELSWIEPQDASYAQGKRLPSTRSPASDGGPSSLTSFEPATDRSQKTLDDVAESVGDISHTAAKRSSIKPIYTVPSNATLMGSIAMTALIGRVPIDGTVNDPYPFKVLIGSDNLIANGIDLPDVAGAVVSGTASGDWTLSCVRGQIRSMTFVFQDGTVRTLPSSSDGSDIGSQNTSNTTEGGLGWISDPHGIPCVSGERRSNAQQYLGSQALITAAGAGAASLINSDSGNVAVVSGRDGSLGTVGISGNEAVGRILAGGVQEMSQWVNKLYGQAFAAIYVQPGAQVAVHIEQALTIDYDGEGRKVRHQTGGVHVSDLD